MRIHVSGRHRQGHKLDLLRFNIVAVRGQFPGPLPAYVHLSVARAAAGQFRERLLRARGKKKITDISVEILTLEGEGVKFEDSETPSRLVLHFRKFPLAC